MKHINLSQDREHLIITFPYSEEALNAVREVPGRKYDASRKRWIVPIVNADICVDMLRPAGFTPSLEVNTVVFAQHCQRNAEIRERPHFLSKDSDLIPMKEEVDESLLYDFQKKGMFFLYTMRSAMLADAQGLGKTLQTISSLQGAKKVLILCPASLKFEWEKEIKKWRPNDEAIVIDGDADTRYLKWGESSDSNVRWFIVNYELLLRIGDFRMMKKITWDAVVCDEATRISNPMAKTTRAVFQIPCSRRIALTGTPISNSPMDLYAPMSWIAPGILGKFSDFQARYCKFESVDVSYGRGKKFVRKMVGFRNLDELARVCNRFILRRTKEEVLKDLPPKTFQEINFELTPAERKVYEGVRRDIAEEVKKLSVAQDTIPIVAVKILRLKQITGSADMVTKMRGAYESSKIKALKELLQPIVSSGEKAIIFTQFAEMATKLQADLSLVGYRTMIIKGSMEAKERAEEIELFKKEGDIIVMTEAGAYGLNLQEASYVIHFDLPWSVAKLQQREDRAHRIGQMKPVTVYSLVAKDTVDEYVAKVLHGKNKVSVEVLGDVERLETAGISQEDIKNILRI